MLDCIIDWRGILFIHSVALGFAVIHARNSQTVLVLIHFHGRWKSFSVVLFSISRSQNVTCHRKRRMKTRSMAYFSNHQIKLMTRQKFSRLSPQQPEAACIISFTLVRPFSFRWLLGNYTYWALEWTTLECGEHLTRMAMCHRRRSLEYSLIIILHIVGLTGCLDGWRSEEKKKRGKCEMSSVIGIKNGKSNKLIIRIVWQSFFFIIIFNRFPFTF